MAQNIGNGAYGQVWFKPEDKCATKIIAIEKQDTTNMQSAIRELHVLRYSHANIVHFQEVKFRYNNIEFYMERMDMDLLKLIRKGSISYENILFICTDVLQGLHFLHSNYICHRDIKPSNILINETGGVYTAKLCDFGLSRQFSNEMTRGTDYMVTRWYRAPEVINRSKGYKFGIDMWAFGCIVYEMATRQPMFPLVNESDLEQELEKVDEKLKDITNAKVQELVKNLIVSAPQTRWDARACISFLTGKTPPTYTKSYYLGSNIQDSEIREWFTDMLDEHPGHERAIMYGIMLVNGSPMTLDDCRYAVLMGFFLYETVKAGEFLLALWKKPSDTNCRKVIRWMVNFYKTNPNWFFISPYEIENIGETVKELVGNIKRRKLE